MNNISRFEPFRASSIRPLDDVLSGFFRPMRIDSQAEMQIKMDVRENDTGYAVHAEIPGVKKEDLRVTINGNEVSISADVKQEKEIRDGEKLLRSERHYGKITRTFLLGSEVDDSQSGAKYSEGVLELTLPKKAVTSSKTLTIS